MDVTKDRILTEGFWKSEYKSAPPVREFNDSTSMAETALTPGNFWFPITEEMAIKMRILHGF